ncbi:MAG: hypothetical protein FWG05_04240, partial [Kiritimatiellaeota bacterium]|nr:hypothetical protein [Kiritimatiellota bacterium]
RISRKRTQRTQKRLPQKNTKNTEILAERERKRTKKRLPQKNTKNTKETKINFLHNRHCEGVFTRSNPVKGKFAISGLLRVNTPSQ